MENFISHKNLLYVYDGPSQLQITQHLYDMPMVGHFGDYKTLDLVS